MSFVSQMSVYVAVSSEVSEENKSSLSDNRCDVPDVVSKTLELIDSLNSSSQTQGPSFTVPLVLFKVVAIAFPARCFTFSAG